MRMTRFFTAAVTAVAFVAFAVVAEAKTKIVILAGAKSHPSGQHEFFAGANILAKALNEQSGLEVEAVVVQNGWPEDEKIFDGAKAIICYADGGGKHPFMTNLEKVDALAKKGVGIMCMHYAVEVSPGKPGEYLTSWIGGFYESKYSVNPHWDADTQANAEHPVGRGVSAEKIHDEWYFRIRFPENSQATRILTATPERKNIKRYIHWNKGAEGALGQSQALMWGIQRPDGGRGIGYTGGHWHRNWAIEAQRKLVLNAIVWVAGVEVPEGGVKSEAITEAQLNENLDAKEPMVQVKLPSPEDFNLPPAEPIEERNP